MLLNIHSKITNEDAYLIKREGSSPMTKLTKDIVFSTLPSGKSYRSKKQFEVRSSNLYTSLFQSLDWGSLQLVQKLVAAPWHLNKLEVELIIKKIIYAFIFNMF